MVRVLEKSKSNIVDVMVSSNGILYEPGEHPDHVIVIKVKKKEEVLYNHLKKRKHINNIKSI